MKGRDPMKGRHSVGVQRVNTGKTRASQSEPASNKVKTQVPSNALIRTQQPKAPVLSDAAHPSSDAQKLLRRPPQPFENPNSTVNVRAAGAAPGGVSTMEPRIASGLQHSSPGARALPNTRPVGWKGTAPTTGNNQVISGRTGSQQLARKRGDNGSGYPSKRNAAFYGDQP